MRNFLIGLLLGVALTAGVTIHADKKGPNITGESGRLRYAIVVDGAIECAEPWVSIPEKMIECDSEAPDGPGDRVRTGNNVGE